MAPKRLDLVVSVKEPRKLNKRAQWPPKPHHRYLARPSWTEFHVSIAAATHNRVLQLVVQMIMAETYEMVLYEEMQSAFQKETLFEPLIAIHRQIVEAIEAHAPDAAAHWMRRHLEAFAQLR
jgi:DNA-binding FadR family transcriptional regulator